MHLNEINNNQQYGLSTVSGAYPTSKDSKNSPASTRILHKIRWIMSTQAHYTQKDYDFINASHSHAGWYHTIVC